MTEQELMVFLKGNPDIASKLLEMTENKAKQLYVSEKHHQAIIKLKSTNKYRDGHYCTHITKNNKRTLVERSTEEALIEYLYDFYRAEEKKDLTFDEVFELFVDFKRSRGRSEGTASEYRRYWAYLSPVLRNKNIIAITEDELRNWLVNDFLKREKTPKKECLKKMLQLIKAIFTFGIRRQYCFEDPSRNLYLEDYTKYCRLDSRNNEERSFSDNELQMLRDYCLTRPDNPHAAVMLVAMETGMRAGELTALMKEDIGEDFITVHRQQIKVPKTDKNPKSFFTCVNYTKNERANPKGGRPVPITSGCRKALDNALKLPGESEYLFHHPDGSPVLKESYLHYLRRVCDRLGITITHNHAFRVSYNAKLIRAGVTGNERCLVMGHSMQTNERHYSFSDKRQAQDVKAKLDNLEAI